MPREFSLTLAVVLAGTSCASVMADDAPTTKRKTTSKPPAASRVGETPARAVESPEEILAGKDPAELLKSKGLELDGVVYILPVEKEARELKARLEKLQEEWTQVQQQLMPIRQSYAAAQERYNTAFELHSELQSNNNNSVPYGRMGRFNPTRQNQNMIRQYQNEMNNARRAMTQAEQSAGRHTPTLARIDRDAQKVQGDLSKLLKQMKASYGDLAADDQVKAAFRLLNKGRGPGEKKIVMGPVFDEAGYKSALARMARGITDGLGVSKKGKRSEKFQTKSKTYVNQAHAAARADRLSLAKALAELDAVERDGPKRAAGTDSSKKASEAETVLRARVASARKSFVKDVAEFRRVADEAQAEYESLANDPEVLEAVAELGGRGKKAKPAKALMKPVTPGHLADLEQFEKEIRSGSVPVKREGATILVEARFGSEAGVECAADPSAPEVILGAKLAARAGVRPVDGSPVVRVTLPGGKTVAAHRAVLESVKVGMFEARGVPCAVVSAGQDEPTAVLGAPFLGRFVVAVSDAKDELTLTEVNVPPAAHSSAPRALGAKGRVEKKTPAGR